MIKILSGGLYTTIQDMGRFGYRKFGVPSSGAMDRFSAVLANKLLGNPEGTPVLEYTFTGPVLEFQTKTVCVVTGAGFTPSLNHQAVPLNTRFEVPEGAVLTFGLASYGLRGYLAVPGGFAVPEVLGSYSFYPQVTAQEKLRRGDELQILDIDREISVSTSSLKIPVEHYKADYLEVFKGPEFANLSEEYQKELEDLEFEISNESNRMAYFLEHDSEINTNEILTSAVQPGTVQLTPSGRVIVLMRDAQTTGGYARILQLSENSINQLSQKRTGDKVKLKLI